MNKFILFIAGLFIINLAGPAALANHEIVYRPWPVFWEQLVSQVIEQMAPAEQSVEQTMENDYRPAVDEWQIRDIQKQIKDLQRDIKKLLKQAGKVGATAETARLNELVGSLNNTLTIISGPRASEEEIEKVMDAINDFHDGRPWDVINEVRARVELPKQIADMEKSVVRLQKLVSSKSTQKAVILFGLNLTEVNNIISATKQSLQEVKTLLQNGDTEEAQEEIRGVWDNDINMIEGVIHNFRGLSDALRAVKKNNIIEKTKSLIQPGIDAFHAGDYQEAQELLRGVENEVRRMVDETRRPKQK